MWLLERMACVLTYRGPQRANECESGTKRARVKRVCHGMA